VQAFRWPILFGTVLGLLIFSLCASFIFKGAAAWLVGLIYISYDSLLLGFMVVSSQLAIARDRRDKTSRELKPPAAKSGLCCPNASPR
jgi:hypothetical protein